MPEHWGELGPTISVGELLWVGTGLLALALSGVLVRRTWRAARRTYARTADPVLRGLADVRVRREAARALIVACYLAFGLITLALPEPATRSAGEPLAWLGVGALLAVGIGLVLLPWLEARRLDAIAHTLAEAPGATPQTRELTAFVEALAHRVVELGRHVEQGRNGEPSAGGR